MEQIKIQNDTKVQKDLETKLAKPDESIREHTDKLKIEAKRLLDLGYISHGIYSLLDIACEYHDYGKLNYRFQNRIKNKSRFDEDREVPHNILSMLLLPKEIFVNKEDYYMVLMAIVHHHKLRDHLTEILEDNKETIKDNLQGYEEYATNLRAFHRKTVKRINDLINDKNPNALIIKGLLHKCDYSASAGIPSEFKNDFLTKKLNELCDSWRERDKEANWKELQKFCMKNTDENLIITAPTGMGKTEAGLWWIGNHKGFFVLPLRTAINAMYERIAEVILKNEKIPERLALLHSDMKAYYLEDDRVVNNIENYMECTSQMALPLTISTLDQLFDFVFQYPGYEYKLAQLSYAKIVIDEIQMYDTTLLAYLIYGIERIHQVGGKVAVLTATLPPFVENELKNAMGGDFVQSDYSGQGMTRHNVQILEKVIDSNDIREKYLELLERDESAKILVVCNSIENAQDIYGELSDLGAKLLHSKFIKKDRNKKEDAILKCGKTFADDENKVLDQRQEIWISTSLVEASLDIDFDYLFTELNDIFSLFQRFGRCNRKGVKEWYKNEPNCFVYRDARGSVKTYLEKSYMYQLSKDAVENLNGVITEKGKKEIIDKYFCVEKIRNTDYAKDYFYIKDLISENPPYEHEKGEKLRDISTVDVIPYSVYESHQEEIECINDSLEDTKTNQFERIELISRLKQYCLSAQVYEEKQCETRKKIKLGHNHFIKVIECDYSEEFGFVKNTKKNKHFEEERLRTGGIFID